MYSDHQSHCRDTSVVLVAAMVLCVGLVDVADCIVLASDGCWWYMGEASACLYQCKYL